MKRRDFVKTTACMGCIGALGYTALKSDASVITDIRTKLEERKFIYKTEADLPKKIRIDICNLCQLNCVACWMREWEEEIKKYGGGFGYTKFETYKDFIDKHPFIEEIEVSNGGEIFLNPDLDKILEYSYQKNIRLNANNGVNLNYITEETAENLVKYKFNEMMVSIDGASPETYAIYRRGGDFNKVINNVKLINKYKEKYNSEYPRMKYKMVLFGHNEHEVAKAKELAKELNMDILFDVNSVDWYSAPLSNPEKTLKEAGLLSEEPICLSVQNIKENPDDFFVCKTLFHAPQINWNGDLLGCCVFFGLLYNTFNVNVFKEGLLNALNNENFLYTKAMISTNLKPNKDFVCLHCFVYDDLKKNNVVIKPEQTF